MTDLNADLVRRAGIALYGEEWQTPLARLLGVDPRTMRRLAKAVREGEAYRVTPGWWPEIKAALQPIPLEREIQGRFASEVLEAINGAAATPPPHP